MHIIKAFLTSLSLAYLASCLDTTDVAKRQDGPPASGGERIVQIVQVSDTNGTLKFFPEEVRADVGSVVQFQFYPKVSTMTALPPPPANLALQNHTITESSFAAPCVPIAANLTTPQRPGQKSGFVPVTSDTQFRPIYNLIVNDTKPMWIYCGQAPHCQKGMSMVINVNQTDPNKTLEKYKAAAAALPLPGASSSSSSATTSAGATTVTPAPAGGTTVGSGPSLAGSTTTSSASASASIQTFNGGASTEKPVNALAMAGLLAGAIGIVW